MDNLLRQLIREELMVLRVEHKEVWQLTKREFLGKPRITKVDRSISALHPTAGKIVEKVSPESFMNDKYTIYRDESKYPYSVVMDNDLAVAEYDGSNLLVHKKYRKQGIGTALVIDFRTRNPEIKPARTRTRVSQRLQRRAHEEIVYQAILDRKKVPSEVLKGYPNLQNIYNRLHGLD
jgi:GNAT superfamily N-acetyltransferase